MRCQPLRRALCAVSMSLRRSVLLTELYMFFSPFKVARYRKVLLGDYYVGEFDNESFAAISPCSEINLTQDNVQDICAKAYEIFITEYQQRDFAQEIIINAIERYDFGELPRFKHDFRLDGKVKSILKEQLSAMKDRYSISDLAMNTLMLATWDAFIKFKVNKGYEMIAYSHNLKIKCKQKLTFEPYSESEVKNVW